METYTILRQFADSWALLALTLFYLGVIVFAFRPGSRAVHDEISKIPLRDDDDLPVSERYSSRRAGEAAQSSTKEAK
ncbi:MAG: cbb3-type cytochrome c oxidase subunit 3 [Pseudomonadota bacterium]